MNLKNWKHKKMGRCDYVMDHAVISICIQMQLQTVFRYSYTSDMILITYFENHTQII
jgi:hypothetical protein